MPTLAVAIFVSAMAGAYITGGHICERHGRCQTLAAVIFVSATAGAYLCSGHICVWSHHYLRAPQQKPTLAAASCSGVNFQRSLTFTVAPCFTSSSVTYTTIRMHNTLQIVNKAFLEDQFNENILTA